MLWKTWLVLVSLLFSVSELRNSKLEATASNSFKPSNSVLSCCPGPRPDCPPWCDDAASGP